MSLRGFFNSPIQLAEGNNEAGLGPVELIRTGIFSHPDAPDGKFEITNEHLLSFKNNYDNNERRLDKEQIAIDYGHDTKGPASGWITAVEHRQDGTDGSLWITPEWTKNGEQKILEKEYRFISADIDLNYQDNENEKSLGPTLLGAGLVNRPHIKAMQAVFNEQTIIENTNNEKEFSMSPEEMMKKIGELETTITSLKTENEGLKSKAQAGEDKGTEFEKKFEETEKQLSEQTEKVKTLEEKSITQDKEAKFSEYLNAGKILPAQKCCRT